MCAKLDYATTYGTVPLACYQTFSPLLACISHHHPMPSFIPCLAVDRRSAYYMIPWLLAAELAIYAWGLFWMPFGESVMHVMT